jgi:hypothetical protein
MPKPTQPPPFAEITARIVRDSPHPIPFAEILNRVNAIRPIETNSPKGTIRSAISQCRFIAPDGQGNYGWSPRMMKGAQVRVALVKGDLQHKPPRIEFDDDAREMLWPNFFGSAKYGDREPVQLEMPNGKKTSMSLDFLGATDHEGHWGTIGSLEFWVWLKSVNAMAGDDLIFETLDGEQRRYGVRYEPQSQRDTAVIGRRTAETIEAGANLLRSGRGKSVDIMWDMARILLVSGHYAHPVPPRPIGEMWPTMLHRAKGLPPPTSDVYQIKVTLEDIHPSIWRRILVPADWSLGALHYVIQVAMGWTNSHLHHFIFEAESGRNFYSLYWQDADDLGVPTTDSSKINLSTVAPKTKTHFRYEYDFGDSWLHHIVVEKIVPPDPNEVYPRCTEGKRACPPDDCGGAPGYENLLKIIRDPEHPEHDDMQAWLSGMDRDHFDPESFDLLMTNRRLSWINPKQLAAERNVKLFV